MTFRQTQETRGPETGLQPEQLLANCAREDLAHIGSIQPFACILVADPVNLRILACSSNVEAFFGCPASDLLGQELRRRVGEDITMSTALLSRDHGFALPLPGMLELPTGRHHVSLSRHNDHILVEIEPVRATTKSEMQRQAIMHRPLQTHATHSVSEVVAEFAHRFIEIAPFDRVLVYQFLDDWSGRVICEKGQHFQPTLLGLHFPASDIPVQARRQYETMASRLIADTEAAPIAFEGRLPDKGFDLSQVRSRACSKVHLIYLNNMGVRASFSCSIMFRGQLWGLIACHHTTPIHLDLMVRLDCERIARSLSVELMRIHAERKMQMIENFKHSAKALIENLPDNIDSPRDFSTSASGLCDLLEADGLAIVRGDVVHCVGLTPTQEETTIISEIVASKSETRLFKTNCLSAIYPGSLAYAKDIAGLLAISTTSLSQAGSDSLMFIWFRREFLATVNWAGKPEKSDSTVYLSDGTPVLSPRSSFAIWSEEKRHSCRPWTSEQVFKANLWVHNYARKRSLTRILSSDEIPDTLPLNDPE